MTPDRLALAAAGAIIRPMRAWCWAIVCAAAALPAEGVIFLGTADPAYHANTAPAGVYQDSGWQYQGLFGNFLGTMISPQHFITAAHVGVQSTTFVWAASFNGGADDVTFTRDTGVNGGLGYWDIAGTDLRIYQITGTFPHHAPLYAGGDEVGRELVVIGRGTQRGATVQVGGADKGWRWGTADHVARWGRNDVSQALTVGSAEYLWAAFDAVSGEDEAHLSGGDSGGAAFILEAGVWRLAGIHYAVDGYWDTNDVVGDGLQFNAALFDAGGLYNGSDAEGWTYIEDRVEDIPSGFYTTRISAYLPEIAAITGVPEPAPALAAWGLLALGLARRRRG